MWLVPDSYQYDQYLNMSFQQLKIDQLAYSKSIAFISSKIHEEISSRPVQFNFVAVIRN
jgi:hypothetical protein